MFAVSCISCKGRDTISMLWRKDPPKIIRFVLPTSLPNRKRWLYAVPFYHLRANRVHCCLFLRIILQMEMLCALFDINER